MKNLLIALCLIQLTAHAQMQVQGRFLYNKCGQKVTIRGIEHMLYYQDINQQMLPEIGKTGANAIRVLLDPGISGTTLRQILTKCITEQKMYVSVGVWSGRDFFFRADIKPVLLEFEDNIILHGFGEPNYETTPDDARWKSESIAVINQFRSAGYKAPIDIQTTTFGRDPNPIIRSGQAVFNADPLRNIIFGCQMYWGDWYTGLYGMTIAQGCQRFAQLPYPVQVGACPSDCNTDCGRQAWDESYKNGLGCMWWSWTGDEFELSGNGNFNNLTADGQYVVNTSAYSITKTSVRSIPCSNANLALNRPAFSSSNENSTLTPGKATDGNLTTRWSSLFSDPQWIYVDLGATYNINRVVLRWEVAYGKSYTIQTSPNASTWTTIFTTTTGNGAVDDLAVTGTGRYVRMRGTVRGTTYGYSLWEFEVYGAAAPGSVAKKPVAAEELSTNIPESYVLVSPNPASLKNISVRIYSDLPENATVTLLTEQSQRVATINKTLARGWNVISIPARHTPNGLYFINVQQGNKRLTRKVVIQD
jgi:hypothetical protein